MEEVKSWLICLYDQRKVKSKEVMLEVKRVV